MEAENSRLVVYISRVLGITPQILYNRKNGIKGWMENIYIDSKSWKRKIIPGS